MYSYELDPLARTTLNAWIALRQLGWPATALTVKTAPQDDDMTLLAITVRDGDRAVDLPIGRFSALWTPQEIIDDFLQALKVYSSGRLIDAQRMIDNFGGLNLEDWSKLTGKVGMPVHGPELRN